MQKCIADPLWFYRSPQIEYCIVVVYSILAGLPGVARAFTTLKYYVYAHPTPTPPHPPPPPPPVHPQIF